MIKTLRAENVFNLLNWISAISTLVSFYSVKPDDNWTPDTNYGYISMVSSTPKSKTQFWNIMKTARVSLHIVCKKTLSAWQSHESVLSDIIDTVTNEIVFQWCNWKINHIDWFSIQTILEDTVSPIFFSDWRYYVVKDYLFNYISVA